MAKFWEVKTVGYVKIAEELKACLPELKNSYRDDIVDNLHDSNLMLIQVEEKTAPFWIRITLPFALLLMIILLVLLPVKFMFTGIWAYRWKWTTNWFKALGF